jgi:hypothetical protein
MEFRSLTRLALVLMAGATIAVGAGAARADPLASAGMTVEDINSWLRTKGCDTAVGDKGDYVVCKMKGYQYVVFTADCENQHCKSLQFFYGISFDNKGVKPDHAAAAEFINGWNTNYRWVKAWVDENRDVGLETDFLVSPGGTTDGLNGTLDLFLGGVGVFSDYLDGKANNAK